MKWNYRKASGWQDGDTYYGLDEQGNLFNVVKANHGISSVIKYQPFSHWIIARAILGKSPYIEPTYKQKVMCLREVGDWKRIAFEVMPPQSKVVDRANVYHMWEFEHPLCFSYEIGPIYLFPFQFERETQGIMYHVSHFGATRYLYFRAKDGKELGWMQKQQLKNEIFGYETCAVEIITEEMLEKPYGCLIVFPEGRKLDISLV